MTRHCSQAMAVGQTKVLLLTQLCGLDEVKWTSKARGEVEKEGDVSLIGDAWKTGVLCGTQTVSPQSYCVVFKVSA